MKNGTLLACLPNASPEEITPRKISRRYKLEDETHVWTTGYYAYKDGWGNSVSK